MATSIWDDATGVTFNDIQDGRLKKPSAAGVAPNPVVAAPAAPLPQRDSAAITAEPKQISGMAVADLGGTTTPSPVPAMPVPLGIAANVAINPSPRQAPKTIADVPRPANQAVVMRGAANEPSLPTVSPAIAPAAMPTKPVDTSSGPTVSDGAGGVYTPERGTGGGILDGIINMFKDSATAARTGVHYDQIKADRLANKQGATASPAATSATPSTDFKQDPFAPTPNPMGINPATDGQYMTGKDGAKPDSSGGGFTQNGVSYNVNPSSQDGITKITATGKSPLYTNIRPEEATAGLNNQMIGGNAASVQEGIDRYARANPIRQSMIDSQVTQPSPAGDTVPSVDQTNVDNAEKTQRWAIDDMIDRMKRAGTRTERAALGQAINTMLSGQNQIATEVMRGSVAMRGQDSANGIAARRDDITARTEANRLAGNPLDQQIKQNAIASGAMSNATAKQLQDLIAAYSAEADPAKQRAMAEQIRVLSGKGSTDRFIPVQGGEELGPDGTTKIRRPSSIFDASTRQFIPSEGSQQQGASGADKIKADVQAGKISRDEAIKQLKAMGYQ